MITLGSTGFGQGGYFYDLVLYMTFSKTIREMNIVTVNTIFVREYG